MAFRGTFDHSLDAKNRLTVPREFRGELQGGMVLAKGVEPCISIWTQEGFDAHTGAVMANFTPGSPERDALQRFYNSSAFNRQLDGVHRVALPPQLMEHAGLSKEVTVIGNGDSVEVWDRAAWTTYDAQLHPQVSEIRKLLGHTA